MLESIGTGTPLPVERRVNLYWISAVAKPIRAVRVTITVTAGGFDIRSLFTDRGRDAAKCALSHRFQAVTLRNFRYVALTEATTFLALLIASAIKNTGGSEVGVQILGPIHGLLFIAYVVFALQLRAPEGWTGKQTAWILVGAALPFGGYVVDWWLLQRERLSR